MLGQEFPQNENGDAVIISMLSRMQRVAAPQYPKLRLQSPRFGAVLHPLSLADSKHKSAVPTQISNSPEMLGSESACRWMM